MSGEVGELRRGSLGWEDMEGEGGLGEEGGRSNRAIWFQ